MEISNAVCFRLREDRKLDAEVLEIKRILKERGTVFSDYVKEAVISHFHEDEKRNADYERRKEDYEELKNQLYKMRVWLIKNGMPDE